MTDRVDMCVAQAFDGEDNKMFMTRNLNVTPKITERRI